jgi:hypothetical protein
LIFSAAAGPDKHSIIAKTIANTANLAFLISRLLF